MGHVNNKEYLKWMELAALEHSNYVGWSTEKYFQRGGAFIARAHWIEYLRPTFAGDSLVMYTWVENMQGKTSLRRFYLLRDKKVCMRGATEWAFIDMKTGRAVDIYPDVADSFTVLPIDSEQIKELPFKVGPVGQVR